MKMLNPPEGNPVVIPAFIAKLWHMVSDPETDSLISWGFDGTSFVIKDHNIFSSEMLPRYYKHNNMASFIRQLNMYSFHKVLSIDSPSLKNNKELEFSHPYFQKDQPNLLKKIQRKIHSKESGELMKTDTSKYNKLLLEVKQLRAFQELFGSKLNTMKQENAALWREYSILRQRHAKQEKVVNKVIQFLITMVQQSSTLNANFAPRKVGIPLMIKDKPTPAAPPPAQKKRYMLDTVDGPIICELDPNDIKLEAMNDDPSTFKVIRSSNKSGFISVPAEVYQLPTGNKINMTQENPVYVSTQNDAPTIELLNALQGEAMSIPANADSTNIPSASSQQAAGNQSNETLNEELLLSKPTFKHNILQPSAKAKIKRRNSKKSDGSSKKRRRMTTESTEAADIRKIEMNLLNDLIETTAPQTSSFSTSDAQPIITSPTTSFEARTPVPSHFSPLNEATEEQLPENILEGKPLSYINELIEEAQEQEQEQQARPELTRSNSLSLLPTNLPSSLNKEEADSHLDKMQSEIEVLKEILQNDGLSLDANTILELFKEDPLALNLPPSSMSGPPEIKHEIMTYSPSFDVDLSEMDDQDALMDSENLIQTSLNTPQIQSNDNIPLFPS